MGCLSVAMADSVMDILLCYCFVNDDRSHGSLVQMLEWANQYGGVYKFSLGFQWVVVVSDPRVAVQVGWAQGGRTDEAPHVRPEPLSPTPLPNAGKQTIPTTIQRLHLGSVAHCCPL